MKNQYKVVVHYPKAQCKDSLVVCSCGIREAIEDVFAEHPWMFEEMVEGREYEIISVEKIDEK